MARESWNTLPLRDAFELLLSIKKRNVMIGRPGITPVAVYVSPTDYTRTLAGPSDTKFTGREFIIPKEQFILLTDVLRRGDKVVDVNLGTLTVTDFDELYDETGNIIGIRFRTD